MIFGDYSVLIDDGKIFPPLQSPFIATLSPLLIWPLQTNTVKPIQIHLRVHVIWSIKPYTSGIGKPQNIHQR